MYFVYKYKQDRFQAFGGASKLRDAKLMAEENFNDTKLRWNKSGKTWLAVNLLYKIIKKDPH